MAAIYFPSVSPQGSPKLTADLIAGVVNAAALQFLGPLVGYAAPQDDARVYISFSLGGAKNDCTVSPGNLAVPAGYSLSRECPNLEFGGTAMSALVKGIWYVTADLGDIITIVTIRKLQGE